LRFSLAASNKGEPGIFDVVGFIAFSSIFPCRKFAVSPPRYAPATSDRGQNTAPRAKPTPRPARVAKYLPALPPFTTCQSIDSK
jgi:hypothetical protein